MVQETFHGTGKRKTAIARVWIRPGNGQISVNKKPFDEYFDKESDRSVVMEPLKLTNMNSQYDVYANVRGGGTTGQAGAIRHGISRALVTANPKLRDPLKKEGYLTRDSRMKERKKYGQPGARARYQYSKR